MLLERIRSEKEELIQQGKIKRDKKVSIIFRGDDNSYYEKIGEEIKNIDTEIPFVLPNGWIWCRGYSCFLGMENMKPQGDFFDYIDIDSVDNQLHRIKKPKHLSVNEAPSRASRAVKYGSVLFSLVRPYLENIAFVEEKYSHSIASTGFYVCNSNGLLLPEFMIGRRRKVMAKIVKETIHAKGIDIGIYTTNFESEFISLTDIAKYRNEDDPSVLTHLHFAK